jgi:glucose/arabinose dehydrogenase
MKWWPRIAATLAGAIFIAGVGLYWFISTYEAREPSRLAYARYCADCHGAELEGAAQGPALVNRPLVRGDSTPALIASIPGDIPAHRTPGWEARLSPEMVKALALFVSERRQRFPTTAQSYDSDFTEADIISQHARYRVEKFADLASRPYAMAPLPDGRILVSEKVRGLSMVDTEGVQGELVSGIPRVWEPLAVARGSYLGWGQMLDVALHPEYEENGWVYLAHADRCQLDCGSAVPVSMVRVVRGRIRDGRWIDQEIVWSVHHDYYTVVPDGVAGGRLAFDGDGYLFITVGGKSTYDNLHKLDTPYGKIHRVAADGRVPDDNPFWLPAEERPEASTRHTVWSYGHRTVQGLASHPGTGEIWSTEMGPRGGDEVNRIVAGGNYGWPLYTHGLDYNAEPITIGLDLGLDFPIESTELPVFDFTPAPAISNFIFYRGDSFPAWTHDLLVGSLKAQTLYRLRIQGDDTLEVEKLVEGLGRIRDVETGADGHVYVLLEHGDSGSLFRLVPTAREGRAPGE